MTSHYSDALLSKLQVIESLDDPREATIWINGLTRMIKDGTIVPNHIEKYFGVPESVYVDDMRIMREDVATGMKRADVFYVGSDAGKLIAQGAAAFDADQRVSFEWSPSLDGYLFFADHSESWKGHVPAGERAMRAISWHIDPLDRSYMIVGMYDTEAPYRMVYCYTFADNGKITYGTPDSGFSGSEFDQFLYQEPDAATKRREVFDSWAIYTRAIASAWLFMAQKVVITHQERPNRMARQREESANVPILPLNVIHLRAAMPSGQYPARLAGESETEHRKRMARWMVRGHWRQQAYGPGWAKHRPVWILPHIAGNPDAPVRHVEKIYAVTR